MRQRPRKGLGFREFAKRLRGLLCCLLALLVASAGIAGSAPHPRIGEQEGTEGGGGASPEEAHRFELDLTSGQVPESVKCWGKDAKLEIAETEDGRVLRFTYTAARRSAAGLGIGPVELPPRECALRMQLKARTPTSLAIAVTEKDRSRYQAFYWLPANRWQKIALPLREMWLAERSRDENGKLDADQIDRFTIVDLANLPGQVGLALGLKDGPQQLDVRRLSIEPLTAGRVGEAPKQMALVDGFDREPYALLPIGSPRLSFERVGERAGLRVEYRLGHYRWAGFVRGIGHLPVKRFCGVRLMARASPAVRLHVVLEERDGSKYYTTCLVSVSEEARLVELPAERFRQLVDTRDENERLDPDQLRVIILVADSFSTRLRPGDRGWFWVDDLALVLKTEAECGQ